MFYDASFSSAYILFEAWRLRPTRNG